MMDYTARTADEFGSASHPLPRPGLPRPMGLRVTGLLLILFGSCFAILGVCELGKKIRSNRQHEGVNEFFLVSGLSAGLLSVVVGIIGTIAARKTLSISAQKRHLLAYLVLTAILSVTTLSLFAFSCIQVETETWRDYFRRTCTPFESSGGRYFRNDCSYDMRKLGPFGNVTLAVHPIVCFILMLTSIVASVYSGINLRRYCFCCRGCCEKEDVVIVPVSYFVPQPSAPRMQTQSDETRLGAMGKMLPNEERPPTYTTNPAFVHVDPRHVRESV